MNEAEKIYFKIDNVYYRFKNPNECREKELELLTFNIEEFINKCLEKINDKSTDSTSSSTLKLTIQFKEVEIIPEDDITSEKIKEKVYNKLSISYNQEDTELNGLSFFVIFLSIFFGISLIDIELEEIKSEFIKQNENKKESTGDSTPTPTIDECLQQIEEEEAAKQKTKSPSL